jgi:hypothetical protein
VSFAEKRTCAFSSATAPAGWYVLTVGSSSYLIHFDTTQSFAVTGVTASCDSFRAALSVGDVIVFTPGATAPNVIHNMTNNVP